MSVMSLDARRVGHAAAALVVLAATFVSTLSVGLATTPASVEAFGHGFVAVTPARLMDTRVGQTTIDGQFLGQGVFTAGLTRDLTVAGRGGVPATGVSAVALNVTAINPTGTSFLTVFPTGTTRPTASNLNTAAGRTMPNMVIVKLGSGGKVSVFNNAGDVGLAVDVLGWYGTNSGFTGVNPARLMDTRVGPATIDGQFAGQGVFTAGLTRTLQVAGRGGVPANGVSAVALNVTAISPSATSFLTVFPTGTARPTASNLNTAAGRTLPNMVIVKLGTGGQIDLFNNLGTTNLAVDVLGWFSDLSDQTGLTPARLMDTRSGRTTVDGQFVGQGVFTAGLTRTLQITGRGGVPATGVTAVALNVTAIDPVGNSFLTVHPAGSARPTASNLNTALGRTAPNMVIVKLSAGGAIDIFNNAADTHLAVDVLAWYGSAFALPPGAPSGSVVVSHPLATGVYGGGRAAPPPATAVGEYGAAAVAMSRDGKFVTFTSHSADLIGQDTNAAPDVFVAAANGNLLERASVDVTGAQLPHGATGATISDNGQFVLFATIDRADPVADTDSGSDIYRFDRTTNTVTLVSVDQPGGPYVDATDPWLSGDGTRAVFVNRPNSTNEQVMVHDLTTNTRIADQAITGDLTSTPQISGDGSVVVWTADQGVGAPPRGNKMVVATDTTTLHPNPVSVNDQATEIAVSFDGDAVVWDNNGELFLLDGAGDYSDGVRVDVNAGGPNAAGTSQLGGFPGTGASRTVLFDSNRGLLPGAPTGFRAVYARNGATTTLHSRTAAGAPANCTSIAPSGGGSTLAVAFLSCATNLGGPRAPGQLRVTVVTGAFAAHVVDMPSQTTHGHGGSERPYLSPDGQSVVFGSTASDLDADDLDDHFDIFMYDVRNGPVALVSTDDNSTVSSLTIATETPTVSNGGEVAAYIVRDEGAPAIGKLAVRTQASNDIFFVAGNASSRAPVVCADGKFVVFESFASDLVNGDLNGRIDLFLFDTTTFSTTRIGRNENDEELLNTTSFFESDISADGRYIAYQSNASNLFPATPGTKVVLLDRETGGLTLVAAGFDPSVTDDGSAVVFQTSAALVAADTNGVADIYRKDIASGALTLVSRSDSEAVGNGAATAARVTGNGRFVVFNSSASNLVAGDSNGVGDVFVRDLLLNTTLRASVGPNGEQLTGLIFGEAAISDDGGLVVFAAHAPGWSATDDNATADVYLVRLPT